MINKNVFNKTKMNLIKINIAVVVGFLFIFSTFICIYFAKTTYDSIDNKLTEELEEITIQLSRSSLFYPIKLKNPSNMVYVYENGKIRYFTENRYFDYILPERKDAKENSFFTYKENGFTFRELYINVGKYKIQIIKNIDSEMSSLKQLISVFIIGIFIAIISTYFIALYLTKKALVPIEIAWNNQAKFIQDASHELRTPITIITSKLETMLKAPDKTINDEVETIAEAMRETRRVKKMVNDLLSLSKEEAISKITLSKFNVVLLLEEICNDYIDIAQMQEKEFLLESSSNKIEIICDEGKLRQLILIFIDNAFKYTQQNDSIIIRVKEDINGKLSIFIIDTGIGIKKEDLPYVFDRFFRSKNARSENIDGSGIGLSIAKMISLNLNIDIKIHSIENEKTIFELIIPIR